MNKYNWFKCLYFDGFAGSGNIYNDGNFDFELIKGSAIRILEINTPKSFDTYYFVELDQAKKESLEKIVKADFPNKRHFVVEADCNSKLISMANYLKENKSVRVLAFIDPFGMSVNWASLEVLKGLGIDMWILVPTGIGLNRLLKRNGDISEAWQEKMEAFLGISSDEIKNHFYKSTTVQTLFGEETFINKENNAIQKAGLLYKTRLNQIFEFVSEPLELSNSTGSIMYHFMMASNNSAAFKIANEVIRKYKK